LSNIKYPYNINILTQEQALRTIENKKQVEEWVRTLLSERELLIESLKQLPLIKHIYPTDANFILVRVEDADAVYQYLVKNSIVVRNRSTVSLCAGCIRITVGTHEENAALIASLRGGVS